MKKISKANESAVKPASAKNRPSFASTFARATRQPSSAHLFVQGRKGPSPAGSANDGLRSLGELRFDLLKRGLEVFVRGLEVIGHHELKLGLSEVPRLYQLVRAPSEGPGGGRARGI